MRSRAGVVVALLVIVSACSSTADPILSSTTAVTATTRTTTSTTTSMSTTSTTSTSTTTTSTTTTTTVPPTPVQGWGGDGIRAASVSVVVDVVGVEADLRSMVHDALRSVGVTPSDDAPYTVSFDLDATALSANYSGTGTCYTGARIRGEARLSDASGDHEDRSVALRGDIPVPMVVFGSGCKETAEEAPFAFAFRVPMIQAMTGLFGPAAMPYLARVVGDPLVGHWSDALDAREEAITAARALDVDLVSPSDRHDLLAAVLDAVEEVRDSEDDSVDHFLAVARSALLDVAPTDFGFDDAAAMSEWRSWLAQWWSDQLAGSAP